MADAVKIPVEIQLILNKWSRDSRAIVRDAKVIEKSLDEAKRAARQLAAALDALKSGKVSFDIDLSALSKAQSDIRGIDGLSPKVEIQADTSQLMAAEIDIQSLDNVSPKVDIQVDSSRVDSAESDIAALDDVSPNVTVDVDADVTAADTRIDNIARRTPHVEAVVDADTDRAESKIKNVGDSAGTVDVPVDADTSQAESAIQNLARTPIQLTFDVSQLPGMIGGALGTARNVGGSFGVDAALELGQATRELQGELGLTEQQAAEMGAVIADVYQNGIGGSIEDVKEMVGLTETLANKQTDLQGVVTSTAQASMLLGTSYEEQLANADKLVTSGLAGSIQEANDALLEARRIGADTNRDITGVIEEFAGNFSAANFSLSEFIGLSAEAFKVGGRNAELVGETVLEMTNSIDTAITDASSDQASILDALGLSDQAQLVASGEMSGAAFMEAFMTETNRQLSEGEIDQSTANNFVRNFFGSNAENFGLERFLAIDWTKVENTTIPEGTVAESAAVYTDTIGNAMTELGRTIQTTLAENFRLAGLPLNDALDLAKDKVREIADLLQSGASIPEALEIALNMPGFADNVHRVEAVLGNFIIELEIIVANLLQGMGTDVSGIRTDIAARSETQLAFDLQTASEDEVATFIQRAMERGVSLGAASDAANTAITEMVENGNVAGARALSSALSEQQVTVELNVAGGLLDQDKKVPISFTATADMTEEEILAEADKLARQYATATGEAVHGIKVDVTQLDLQASDAALQGAVDVLNAQVNEKLAGGQTISAIQQLATAGFTEDAATIAKDAIGGIADSFLNLITPATDAVEPINDIDAVNLAAAALAAGDMATAFQVAQDAGWPITEEQLGLISQAGTDFFTLQTELTEYTLGLEDAKTKGIASLEALRTEGIDPAIVFTDELTESTSAYVLGLQGQLEIAKVTWQDYIDYLTANGIPLDAAFTTPPTVPKEDGFAAGGRASGWAMVGERGPELAYFGRGADVLNNQTSSALMSLMSQLGAGGGSTVNNYINVNVLQNNASIAAGNASAGALSAQLRGFAG